MNTIKSKNKIIAAITVMLLMVSMAIAIAPANAAPAITAPTTGTDVTVGQKVTVSGSGAAIGSLVEIYWGTTAAANKLGEVYADGAGAYSKQVTIPDAVAGAHYLIVRDSSGSTAVSVDVVANIKLSMTSGIQGDRSYRNRYRLCRCSSWQCSKQCYNHLHRR